MTQEPQEVLKCEGVSMSMAWWILLGDRLKDDHLPRNKNIGYKQCFGRYRGRIANNVIIIAASPDYYLWHQDN